jgi:hypothetical protein
MPSGGRSLGSDDPPPRPRRTRALPDRWSGPALIRETLDDGIVRAVILTGSVARGFEHVHPFSDLDVELYV